MKRVCSHVLAAVLAATAALASGHAASSDPLVESRQSDMKAMAAAAKLLGGMFARPELYNAAGFRAAAETIRGKSGRALSGQFGNAPIPPGSRASPDIETERQKFDSLSNDLAAYAGALVSAAERNPDAITPSMRMKPGDAELGGPLARKPDAAKAAASMPAEHAFHMMLQTCTSCHARFRAAPD